MGNDVTVYIDIVVAMLCYKITDAISDVVVDYITNAIKTIIEMLKK